MTHGARKAAFRVVACFSIFRPTCAGLVARPSQKSHHMTLAIIQLHSLVHRSLASDGARSVRAHTRKAGVATPSPGAEPPNENAPTPAARRPKPTAARRSKSCDKLLPRRFIAHRSVCERNGRIGLQHSTTSKFYSLPIACLARVSALALFRGVAPEVTTSVVRAAGRTVTARAHARAAAR